MAIEFLPPPKAAAVESSTDVVYRELTPEEIEQFVKPVYEQTGNPLPSPAISVFVGAVLAGEVIGFICLQLKLHAQPTWIADGYSSIFTSLVHEVERTILRKTGPQWVYIHVPEGRLSKLAEAMGMSVEPWRVLSKLVMPEAPLKPAVGLMEEFPPDQFEPAPEEPVTIQ